MLIKSGIISAAGYKSYTSSSTFCNIYWSIYKVKAITWIYIPFDRNIVPSNSTLNKNKVCTPEIRVFEIHRLL